MTITLSDDLFALLQKNALRTGVSVEEYLDQLIRYGGSPTLVSTDETDEDHGQIDQAVAEGLDDMERGDSVPWEDVVEQFRARHGL